MVAGCFRHVVVLWLVTIVWEFALVDSALVVLDEWSSYRGGRWNRFDWATYSVWKAYLLPLKFCWFRSFNSIRATIKGILGVEVVFVSLFEYLKTNVSILAISWFVIRMRSWFWDQHTIMWSLYPYWLSAIILQIIAGKNYFDPGNNHLGIRYLCYLWIIYQIM